MKVFKDVDQHLEREQPAVCEEACTHDRRRRAAWVL